MKALKAPQTSVALFEVPQTSVRIKMWLIFSLRPGLEREGKLSCLLILKNQFSRYTLI